SAIGIPDFSTHSSNGSGFLIIVITSPPQSRSGTAPRSRASCSFELHSSDHLHDHVDAWPVSVHRSPDAQLDHLRVVVPEDAVEAVEHGLDHVVEITTA